MSTLKRFAVAGWTVVVSLLIVWVIVLTALGFTDTLNVISRDPNNRPSEDMWGIFYVPTIIALIISFYYLISSCTSRD